MRPLQKVRTGYKPRPWQRDIHKKMLKHRFSVLVVHRRGGKTVLSINTLIDAALRCPFPNGQYAYIAPFLKQAKRIAWNYLKDYCAPIPGCLINESELWIRLPNGAQISLYGADNPESLRGIWLDGVVLDEVADMREGLWGTIIRPTLTDRNGWALFIGTPRGMNLFYTLYRQAARDPEWYAAIYRVDQTDVISKKELAAARKTMSEAAYRQEFLCDFSASSDNILITIDMITNSLAREARGQADLIGLPKLIGVDVARFGGDLSVIQRRWGPVAFMPVMFKKVDNIYLAGQVANEINDFNPHATFIDGGRGEGVIDILRDRRYSIEEVAFGGRATNIHFFDKRTEMWDKTRAWLDDRGVLPDHPELQAELCTPMYAYRPDGRMKLESKDEMKERGMGSPNYADALALTFAHDVAVQEAGMVATPFGVQAQTDFDPFDDKAMTAEIDQW